MDEMIFMLNGETLEELDEQRFMEKTDFQALLERYPKLLPGSQIDPDNPRRWILVSREVPIPGEEAGAGQWYLDHLFLDQNGIPTLVEVKRSGDARLRREVVAQMLDYAANSVLYWSLGQIISSFEARCEVKGMDPGAAIAELTGDAESQSSDF